MKYIALFLILCVLVVGGTCAYELLHTALVVTGQGMQAVPAAERQTDFTILQNAMAVDSLEGTVITPGELQNAENYYFKVYTIRLKNNGLLPAEMIEVQLSPANGDILYYGETGEVILGAGKTRDVWVSLLSRNGELKARDVFVTYYIWGHPQTLKFTMSP